MRFKFGRSSYSVAGGGAETGQVTYKVAGASSSTPRNPSTDHAAPSKDHVTQPTAAAAVKDSSGHSEAGMTSTLGPVGGGGPPRTAAPPNGGYLPSCSSDGASEGTPSEEHPEFVDVHIILPDGTPIPITVEYGKQMMDLLVQVAAGNKLSPASHTIHIFDEETGRPVDYKASQSVGSLKVNTLHLVSKKQDRKAERPKVIQPFEKTQRLTVNLPRNQKYVTRVNPKLRLADIYKLVCEEKNLDPYKYDLRHPIHPDQALNMACPLGDYGINEICVVSVTAPENRKAVDLPLDTADADSSYSSMPRLKKSSSSSSGQAQEEPTSYMPGMDGEKKKKKGFLSFLSKKKAGSFKLGESVPSEPMYARSSSRDTHVPQAPPASSPTQSSGTRSGSSGASGTQMPVSAPAPAPAPEVIVRSSQPQSNARQSHPQANVRQSHPQANVKVAPSRKKRAAPPPPQANRAAPPAPVVVTPPPPATTTTTTTTTLNHSRNSSHSSGFDEPTVSPIESPGTTTKADVSAKTISSIEVSPPVVVADNPDGQPPRGSGRMTKSQSMPVKAAPRPVSSAGSHLSGSASLSTLGRKKRKAPAPPPPTGAVKPPTPKPIPEEVPAPVGGSTSTQQTIEVVTSQAEVKSAHAVKPILKGSKLENDVHAVDPDLHLHAVTHDLQPENSDLELQTEKKKTRLPDLTKDADDGASSSSGSLERPRPKFVPPPPPDTPPPPQTPASQERARSFHFNAGGQAVVDSSIQAHVASPCSVTPHRAQSSDSLDTLDDITSCFEATIAAAEEALALEFALCGDSCSAGDEGDFSYPSVSMDSEQAEGSVSFPQESDSISEASSTAQIYEINASSDANDGEVLEEEKKDGEKSDSEVSDGDELPMYPADNDGIVLIKKVSTSEFQDINALVNKKAEKEEINERKMSEGTQPDHVTVVAVGGEPDVTTASDSGHSSATVDKSEDNIDVLENEITFEDEEVKYEEPLNPVNVVAKEEYMDRVERERRESEVEEEERQQKLLKDAREAASRAAAAYENKSPVKSSSSYEAPLITSTPVVQSTSSVPSAEESASFIKPPSPVLSAHTEEVQEVRRERKDSSMSEGSDVFINPEETMFALNDYRIVGLVKEEVIDFSFHGKAGELKKKPATTAPEAPAPAQPSQPAQPMVTSLRQRMAKRPIAPREPLEIADLEAMGLLNGKSEMPPPPEEPAPPIPSEPPEPIVIRQEAVSVNQSQKIYIKPPMESVTDPDEEIVESSEVTYPVESVSLDQSSELSIPNEADPDMLEQERTLSLSRMAGTTIYSDSHSTVYQGKTKGILKPKSPDLEETKPAGILKKKEQPNRVYSSTSSLNSEPTQSSYTKPYSSVTNLASDEKDEDTSQASHTKLKYEKRGMPLGVYGPRPWGASKLKTDTNIMEEINTKFSDRFNNNAPTSPTSPTSPTGKHPAEVRQRVAELGFSPGAERERENVLEEKSLSMMNRKSGSQWQAPTEAPIVDNRVSEEMSYQKSKSLEAEDPSKKSLQTQYEELQKQFNRWQKQLMDNQAILSQKNISAKEAEPLRQMSEDMEKMKTALKQSSMPAAMPSRAAATSVGHRHVDARYEPPKKKGPETGGGGRFTTNDLLSARSRLKSSVSDEDEIERCGITTGRVVETRPLPKVTSSWTPSSPPAAPPVPSLPKTAPPSTKDFPPPPKRVLIQPPIKEAPPSRFGPKLDPREELMITIRNSGGRNVLRKVPVNETKWYSGK